MTDETTDVTEPVANGAATPPIDLTKAMEPNEAIPDFTKGLKTASPPLIKEPTFSYQDQLDAEPAVEFVDISHVVVELRDIHAELKIVTYLLGFAAFAGMVYVGKNLNFGKLPVNDVL